MELMGDGLIAFLAAVGVSTILWLLAETLLRRHRPVAEAILVLPVRGDGATLEHYRTGARTSAARFDIANVLPRYEALYEQVVHQMKADGVHQ